MRTTQNSFHSDDVWVVRSRLYLSRFIGTPGKISVVFLSLFRRMQRISSNTPWQPTLYFQFIFEIHDHLPIHSNLHWLLLSNELLLNNLGINQTLSLDSSPKYTRNWSAVEKNVTEVKRIICKSFFWDSKLRQNGMRVLFINIIDDYICVSQPFKYLYIFSKTPHKASGSNTANNKLTLSSSNSSQ
jgi:hypothetical protein